MKLYGKLLFLFFALLSFGSMATDRATVVDPHAAARALFGRYASLEKQYNPDLANLYSDAAIIRNKRTYPDGSVRTLELPATQYKALIRASMPAARAAGDYSTYSDISFSQEGKNVRVSATRYGVRKKYFSPMSLLVAPQPDGTWLIVEELGESKP
jgi:hypothetical protein